MKGYDVIQKVKAFIKRGKKDDQCKNRSEGCALTGYDIPGRMEDGAWMLWENSSVVVAVAAAAVAHLDLENCHFSSFITESELPECADRSVSSKRVPRKQFLGKVVVGKNQISKTVKQKLKTAKIAIAAKIPYKNPL